ncbi:MAG: nuclear transport factor 2 family protein [Deltaproteobacteria bacterium]|nr:nuclear transport factor 2 family protein [Deltaproteobacteria bacterium]MBW2194838.1 nuclear transport factor 2 family protein [Deltaproteobacteria bacterium]
MKMKKSFSILVTLCIVCLVGIVTAQENQVVVDSIKNTLSGYQKAWNKKDTQKVISYYHDGATIMTGRERKFVTKKEYEKIVPSKYKYGKIKFHEPKITIKENAAEVSVKASFKKLKVKYEFLMVPKGEQWLIRVQEY